MNPCPASGYTTTSSGWCARTASIDAAGTHSSLPPKKQRSGQRGVAELVRDESAVERCRARDVDALDRRAVRERAAHAEPRDADRGRAERAERRDRTVEVGADLVGPEVADQRREVARLAAAGTEEEVRRDDRVALAGEPLGEAEELRRHAVALVDHDDAGPGRRRRGPGGEVGRRDVHLSDVTRRSSAPGSMPPLVGRLSAAKPLLPRFAALARSGLRPGSPSPSARPPPRGASTPAPPGVSPRRWTRSFCAKPRVAVAFGALLL